MTGSWIYWTQGFSSIHHSKRPVRENDGERKWRWDQSVFIIQSRSPFSQATLPISFFCFYDSLKPLTLLFPKTWCPSRLVLKQFSNQGAGNDLHPFTNHCTICGVLQSSFRMQTHSEFICLWSAGKHLLLPFTIQTLINLSQNLVVLDMLFVVMQ